MRVLWMAGLTVLALFAGCLSGDDVDDTTVGDFAFLEPVFTGAEVGEPGVVLQDDGTLWVHAPGGLWKSTDDGATWTDLTDNLNAAGPVLGGDADLAIGSDGTLYYTDLEELVALSVYTSSDGGETWFENPVASMVPGVDRQWIAVGPDVGPLSMGGDAAYLVFNHLATNVFMTKSFDGGMTWVGKPVELGEPQTKFWAMGNVIVSQDDGSVYMTYAFGNAVQPIGDGILPVDYEVRVAASHDGGLTWNIVVVHAPDLNPGHIFPSIAMDSEENLYVVWAQEYEDHFEIQMSTSTDEGENWSDPVKVNQHEGTGVIPWIDASVPGHVAVAWYGSETVAVASENEGPWYVYLATAEDALDAEPTWREARVWDQPVKQSAICTLGIMCQGGRELLDFFQVRIDDQGMTHFAFAQNVGDGTKVFYTHQTDGPAL